MYIPWNDILAPLLMILAIMIVLAVIVIVFSLLESAIFSKVEEWKIRRVMKKIVKANCKELEINVTNIFNGMFDEFMLGKEAADKEFEKIKKSNKKKKGVTNE